MRGCRALCRNPHLRHRNKCLGFFFSSPGFTCSRKANGVELICFQQPFERYWLKRSTSVFHPGCCCDAQAQTSCIIFLSWVTLGTRCKWSGNVRLLSRHWTCCERRPTMYSCQRQSRFIYLLKRSGSHLAFKGQFTLSTAMIFSYISPCSYCRSMLNA